MAETTPDRLDALEAGRRENRRRHDEFVTKTFRTLAVLVALLFAVGGFDFYLRAENARHDREIKQLFVKIQDSRREATRQGCYRDNAKSRALRTFILASLPTELRALPEVQDYLARHPKTFPKAITLALPRRSQSSDPQKIPGALIVRYLAYALKTFPQADCEKRVRDTVDTSAKQ